VVGEQMDVGLWAQTLWTAATTPATKTTYLQEWHNF